MICVTQFILQVPELVKPEFPPSFDGRIGGYDAPGAAEAYLTWLEDNNLVDDYLTTHRWIDSVFPLAIFGMLVAALWGLWGRPMPLVAGLGSAVAAIFLGADLLENAAVAELLRAGSGALTQDAIIWASNLTQIKWGAIFCAVLLCAAGLILTFIKRGRA